ncbi:hypothetical protein RhiirC2_813937 [Rhizophagus irregularis]|uniref:C2H2-type domain-containing protein n=1 Tax=Rhizophagus irregularis TaxID=588596 RepID=A0A2N1MM93_9GLOM|nr:hypothetical protein RhiirC2_813937 [Rhizophagus irregularis]
MIIAVSLSSELKKMWTCNICFKTFDRSTSYYNHHRSHNFNYKISSSEQETSSDEESSEEFSSNQIFSEKDNVYIYNNNDDEGKESDESNDDEESYESDKVEESSKSDENEIISDNLPVPIIEHSIPTTNINEMANSTFSKNDDQTSSDSDEQNFPNEIYRDFKMWTCNICFKTFDRSTSYYNHHRSHNFNYKISSSEQETSSDEESSEEFSSNQIFSEKDNIYIYNNNDEGDESNDDEESYESDKVEESSKSDENEIISDNLPVPIIEHSIPTTNINEMANSTFSKNDDQTSSDSDEQNFPNEIYRDFDGQERSYSEMFNCNWWKQAVNHAPYGSKIVPIIFYSDATTLDHFGKSSRHPIFVTIGNIPTNLCNKPESKALVGLIPILESSKQIKETEEFLKAIRITFHKCFEILLAPIRVQHQTEEMLPRTQQNMQTAINSGLTKEHSIHEQNNAFWNLPYLFLINVFDNIIK